MVRDAGECKEPLSTTAGNDPAQELIQLVDGTQKEVDAVVVPLEQGEVAIEAVRLLPDHSARPGRRQLGTKRLYAEARKVAAGGVANLDGLGLDANGRALATARFPNLQKLVAGMRAVDADAARLTGLITEVASKAPPLTATVLANAQAKSSDPLATDDEKEKAKEDMRLVTWVKANLDAKVSGWRQNVASLPTHAERLRKAMVWAFR